MNQSNIDLKVDYCSYKAAKYAIEHWHYSKKMPVGKSVKFGVWENNKFIDVVFFSRGSCMNLLRPYGLKKQTEGCELTRVALISNHKTYVSKIIKIAILLVKKNSPNLKLIVSYADSKQGHLGKIYQAGNWIYKGISIDTYIKINGKIYHRRSLGSIYKTSSIKKLKKLFPNQEIKQIKTNAKYCYLYPLTKEMKKQILPLAKPYPKQLSVSSIDGDATCPKVEGGSSPTGTLQI